ncbi:MAG: DUF4232 domain-containing protein [Mycobacteriales bacterium]
MGSSQGAAGHMLYVFTLTNHSATTCQMDGYPTLTMYSDTGKALAVASSHGADMAFPAVSPTAVPLAAGATASFSLGFSDVPTSNNACPAVATVAITPPQAAGSVRVKASLMPCGRVDVSPVVAGSNGVSNGG